MAEADESAQATGILSWAYVSLYVFLNSVGRAFYSSQDAQPSAEFNLVNSWALLMVLWYWIAAEGRRDRASMPLDVGFFVVVLGPVAGPVLLWRRQRWRCLLKTGILVAIFSAGYLLTILLRFAIVALR